MAGPAPLDPLAQFRLDGKAAIVTGASSGLGARFARVLHAAGAQVAVTARRLDRLEALAAELPGSFPVQCDVADENQREAMVRAAANDIATSGSGASPPILSLSHRLSKRSRSRASTTSRKPVSFNFVRTPRP